MLKSGKAWNSATSLRRGTISSSWVSDVDNYWLHLSPSLSHVSYFMLTFRTWCSNDSRYGSRFLRVHLSCKVRRSRIRICRNAGISWSLWNKSPLSWFWKVDRPAYASSQTLSASYRVSALLYSSWLIYVLYRISKQHLKCYSPMINLLARESGKRYILNPMLESSCTIV